MKIRPMVNSTCSSSLAPYSRAYSVRSSTTLISAITMNAASSARPNGTA